MNRIYLSKVIGDGLTLQSAYRSAWSDLIGSANSHGATDPKYGFWIGEIETTTVQHDILDASMDVRWINHAAIDMQFQSLSDTQRDKVIEIVTFLGFETRDVLSVFAPTATVRDLLRWLVGHACWAALKSFD